MRIFLVSSHSIHNKQQQQHKKVVFFFDKKVFSSSENYFQGSSHMNHNRKFT